MNSEEYVSLDQFNELLDLFAKALQHDAYETAEEILIYARDIIDNLNRNQSLVQPLSEKPDKVRALSTRLLNYFRAVAEHTVPKVVNSDMTAERRETEIRLMWRLWPVLHRLLILQSNVDFDHENYNQKAAELYGILAGTMESPHAVRIFKECIDQVLPLPGA